MEGDSSGRVFEEVSPGSVILLGMVVGCRRNIIERYVYPHRNSIVMVHAPSTILIEERYTAAVILMKMV
jgi:hypothetical protein